MSGINFYTGHVVAQRRYFLILVGEFGLENVAFAKPVLSRLEYVLVELRVRGLEKLNCHLHFIHFVAARLFNLKIKVVWGHRKVILSIFILRML